MDLRREPVILETDRHRIEGSITLPKEGFRSRLSDFVNQRDRDFFLIEGARVTLLDAPDQVEQVPVLMVASAHIRILIPTESG